MNGQRREAVRWFMPLPGPEWDSRAHSSPLFTFSACSWQRYPPTDYSLQRLSTVGVSAFSVLLKDTLVVVEDQTCVYLRDG